jgi:hypothetical protein
MNCATSGNCQPLASKLCWLKSACARLAILGFVFLNGMDGPAAEALPGLAPMPKKLIEFGWDEPDPAFLRAHLDEMEKTPFDGCVFHIGYKNQAGKTGSFTWESWGKERFVKSDLGQAIDDLKALQPARFKFNFLRFNTTPGRLDWFDDYAAVVNNPRLAAETAREGGCPGILFDIEQYEGALFDCGKQRDRATKSWELYAAQARVRGAQVMAAFQEGYPDLTVFLTFGYSLPWSETRGGQKALAECHYGLLAPFLDGMVEAVRGRSKLIDGCELSYGFKRRDSFVQASHTMQSTLLPIVAAPEKYRRAFSVSFGVWMDKDWRKTGWNTNDFSRNYFMPHAFEASVRTALETADDYVWIYTETPRWWSAEGHPVQVPPAYEGALRRAREGSPALR